MYTDEGKRLKLAREEIGLSQQELADELDRDKSDISRYENGKVQIPNDVLKLFRHKYKYNYEWFIDGTGYRKVGKQDDKRTLITDMTDVKGDVELLKVQLVKQERILKKLYTDFYDKKHQKTDTNFSKTDTKRV